MSNIQSLVTKASNKENFKTIEAYINFAKEYLEFIAKHLQATIVSQNENHYQFYQYDKHGNYQITRPINSNLMYTIDNFDIACTNYVEILSNLKEIKPKQADIKQIINNTTYTIQQSIGATLDGIPGGKANTARKLNGDLFENLIRLIINKIGINANAGIVQVPVKVNGVEEFNMSYQHDLIIKDGENIKVIGSIKTSSKDRIDKIFIDKFLYNKLTERQTPHIAIFLNDVQRKSTKKESQYGINSTFLPGHFKGYTIKLNPLDGVYYCDIRPNMRADNILKDHIKTFDKLLIDDIWNFIK